MAIRSRTVLTALCAVGIVLAAPKVFGADWDRIGSFSTAKGGVVDAVLIVGDNYGQPINAFDVLVAVARGGVNGSPCDVRPAREVVSVSPRLRNGRAAQPMATPPLPSAMLGGKVQSSGEDNPCVKGFRFWFRGTERPVTVEIAVDGERHTFNVPAVNTQK